MLSILRCVIQRDITLAWRGRAGVLSTLFFFIIVVSLFPLGVGPELDVLREIAPGVVWVAALLASMLSLDRMFSHEYVDGSLEQLMLTSQPLSIVVLGKIIAHWLVTGAPLMLIAPVLGLQFDLPPKALVTLLASLLLGTPALSLIGAIGAALTLGLRGGGVLVSLLVLPLCIPVLIFGAGAVEASINGMNVESHLSLLGAVLVLALSFAPWTTAAALRISME